MDEVYKKHMVSVSKHDYYFYAVNTFNKPYERKYNNLHTILLDLSNNTQEIKEILDKNLKRYMDRR